MRIRDGVMSHYARGRCLHLAPWRPRRARISNFSQVIAISPDRYQFLSFLVLPLPSPSFFASLSGPLSDAPCRDQPLDSASLKRIITVIKRIKVVSSCASRSPVSRKPRGMRIAWALVSSSHFFLSHFLLLALSRVSRLFPSPLPPPSFL